MNQFESIIRELTLYDGIIFHSIYDGKLIEHCEEDQPGRIRIFFKSGNVISWTGKYKIDFSYCKRK